MSVQQVLFTNDTSCHRCAAIYLIYNYFARLKE